MTGNWDFAPAPAPPRNYRTTQMCGTLGAIEEQRSYVGCTSKFTNFPRPSRIPRLVTRNKPANTNIAASEQRARTSYTGSYDRKNTTPSAHNYNSHLECGYSTEYENLAVGHFMPVSTFTSGNYNALRPQNGQTTRLTHYQPPPLPSANLDQISSEATTYIPNVTLNSCNESTKENIAQISSDGSHNFLPRSQDDLAVLSADILDSVLASDCQLENAQNQDSNTDLFSNSQTPSFSDIYAYLQEDQTFGNQQESWNRYSVLPPLSANDGSMSPSSTISWFPASRSSFTGRGRKRSHSISPLSAELNTIIRTSPTSLIYLPPSSRCSLNSVSPSPADKPGCYGHLSARNSSTSPRSSSSASGRRISIPFAHSVEPFLLPDSNNLCILQQQGTLKQEQQSLSCVCQPPQHYPFTIPPPINGARPPPPSYDQYMAEQLSKRNVDLKKVAPTCNSTCSVEKSDQDRLYLCEWIECGCCFEDMAEFVRHIEKDHVDKRKGDDFTCYWKGCLRNQNPFNARYKLLNHMRVHSGEKPHKCEVAGCARAFSRQENLKIHLRSHTGERPYACSYEGCGRTFTNPSDRKKHEKTHQEAKPYACQFSGCDKRYTDPSSLRKHAKKHVSKSEHTRKKIRGKNEVENDSLEDCITIQPVRFCPSEENSPTDQRADSGIGRSPRTSHPGSTSDLHLATNHANSLSSETTNHTSPGSHRSSSPLGDINEWEETCFVTSPNSKVPILPPIRETSNSQTSNNIQQRPMSWCTTNEDLIKSRFPLSGYETSTKNNFSASFSIASAGNMFCKQQLARCQSNLDGTANSIKPSSISLKFDVGLYSRQNQFS